ncbi:MAG: aminotransferase class V-fold PLP-dependent enzyme [Deltaproteobacteria bacterium]|nr:aminotransferase class V-fold PLP-dependent enzyme [Deltaproteobacteria bacterium]
MSLKLPIYLDNHATTPVDPRVFEVMKPYFTEIFGNAASSTHPFGWQAEAAVEKAREQVAALINSEPKEIIWTSGTTESINLAVIGAAQLYRSKGNHMITCVTEHRSSLGPSKYLETLGFKVTFLPVNKEGCLDLEELRKAINSQTILVSLMAANNEIGTVHPIEEIGKMTREKGILFHVDAAQGCGRIPIDVQKMGIDLLSMSAHKVYGPKGTGALYIRKKNPHVRIMPILHGGSQEGEIRPGTLAVPNIVGMGKAFEIARQEITEECQRILRFREKLKDGLMKNLDNVYLNGHPTQRLAGNLNLSFPPLRSSDIMSNLRDVAVSSGSACASGSFEPSYVLKALGVGDERGRSSIRFGIGRFNTEEEIDYAIQAVTETVKKLRSV